MSYDIHFKAKLADADVWADVWDVDANITWNVRPIIEASTGLPWLNEEDNGLLSDVMPHIETGFKELAYHPEKYKHLESPNGWGTVQGTMEFFGRLLWTYKDFLENEPEAAKVSHFFID